MREPAESESGGRERGRLAWDVGAVLGHAVSRDADRSNAGVSVPCPVGNGVPSRGGGPSAPERPLPTRARMLVLSPDDTAIIAILRTRPGRAPYAVLPGGGLEPEDADPLAGALRELTEESGLGDDDVDLLTSDVIVDGEQWIFLARAHRQSALQLGDPEAHRNVESHGTYEPVWLRPVDALELLAGRVHPGWITRMIEEGR